MLRRGWEGSLSIITHFAKLLAQNTMSPWEIDDGVGKAPEQDRYCTQIRQEALIASDGQRLQTSSAAWEAPDFSAWGEMCTVSDAEGAGIVRAKYRVVNGSTMSV